MADRVMSERGLELLEDLAHFMRDDPQVRGYVDSMSRELTRAEDLIETSRDQWFAPLDDEYLRIWEYNLGLPIGVAGYTPAQRALIISTHLRKRNAASGASWVATLNQAFGTGTWSYDEDYTPYLVLLTIPYGSATLTAMSVLALAREITPAHIDLLVTYSGGGGGGTFIIGISLIGIGTL